MDAVFFCGLVGQTLGGYRIQTSAGRVVLEEWNTETRTFRPFLVSQSDPVILENMTSSYFVGLENWGGVEFNLVLKQTVAGTASTLSSKPERALCRNADAVKGERGSVLVGVIALSTIMLTAAGGLLLVESVAGNYEDDSWNESRLRYGAESGIMMGSAWLRAGPASFINDMPANATFPITPTPGNWITEDLVQVIVVVENDGAVKRLRSRATMGSETVQITWDIQGPAAVLDVGGFARPRMTNWRETLIP